MTPILNTIKGGVRCKFAWAAMENEIFEHLKKNLGALPILRLPNFHKTFIVECDASNLAIGAILSQEVILLFSL